MTAETQEGVDSTRPSDSEKSADPKPATLSPVERLQAQALEAQIIETLRTVFDPEIPVNIYDMGLIYGIDIKADGYVDVQMTLTSPMCPVAESLPPEVEAKVRSVDGVSGAKVEVVWDPPWTPDKLSEAAKLELNM